MLSTILSIVLSDAVLAAIVFWVFFKYNKQLKKNEVKSSNEDVESKRLENDDKQIDLGIKFAEKVVALNDLMENYNQKTDINWEQYHKDMAELKSQYRQDMSEIKKSIQEIKEEQKLQATYLNGKYAEFKKHLYETETKVSVKTKKTKKNVEEN